MATGDSTRPDPGEPDDQDVEWLTDDDTGRWQITTETSLYLLDLDARTMLRVPGAGAGVQHSPDRGPIPVTALDSDHHVVRLQTLLHCHTGDSMYLLTEPLPDGSIVLRGTTVVQQIRRLDHEDQSHGHPGTTPAPQA